MENHEKKSLIGKILKTVKISKEDNSIWLEFLDGNPVGFRAVADCCSRTWIEHFDIPDEIYGAEIVDFIDESLPRASFWDKHECNKKCGHDYLQAYQTLIKTNKGTISIEYRNDSNGYYGGYLESIKH